MSLQLYYSNNLNYLLLVFCFIGFTLYFYFRYHIKNVFYFKIGIIMSGICVFIATIAALQVGTFDNSWITALVIYPIGIITTITIGNYIIKLVKERNDELSESEEIFRKIAEHTFIGLAVLQNNRFKYINKTFSDTIGYPIEEILNWKPEEYLNHIHPDDIDYVIERTQKAFSGEYDQKKDNLFRVIKTNGEIRWIVTNVSLMGYKGAPALMISQMDITELKRADELLRKSEEKYRIAYERESFYKDLFAHDMNNILHGMLMSLELSELEDQDPKFSRSKKTRLNLFKDQVLRGASLVNNVIKFSEIEASRHTLKNVELLPVLMQAIKIVKQYKIDMEIDIKFEFSDENYIIEADEFLIDTFENILFNSVKHNTNKSIEILIKISYVKENDANYLKMEFIDNGVGIPKYKRESILSRGYKEDRSLSGLGLGLSLVKKILDFYKAIIRIESRVPGDSTKGSNFIFLFPRI